MKRFFDYNCGERGNSYNAQDRRKNAQVAYQKNLNKPLSNTSSINVMAQPKKSLQT